MLSWRQNGGTAGAKKGCSFRETFWLASGAQCRLDYSSVSEPLPAGEFSASVELSDSLGLPAVAEDPVDGPPDSGLLQPITLTLLRNARASANAPGVVINLEKNAISFFLCFF